MENRKKTNQLMNPPHQSIVEGNHPSAIEAERAILGGCLVEIDAMDRIVEIVSENSFYQPIHKVIFSAMKELHDKNDVIDLTTVYDKVKSDEIFNSTGGMKYLLDLSNLVSSAVYIEKHAMIVREK